MYVPSYFRRTDAEAIKALVRNNEFATLVGTVDGRSVASHLPLTPVDRRGATFSLFGHLARNNPLCECIRSGDELLAIFHGPHAYVSPRFYTEPAVPTWNYESVHVYGRPRLVEDRAELTDLLAHLVDRHEGACSGAFRITDLPGELVEAMMGGIVGFEIEVGGVEAAAKLSQNKSAEDRSGIVEGLRGSADPDARRVADAMERVHQEENSEH